jgi:hypothetical protein
MRNVVINFFAVNGLVDWLLHRHPFGKVSRFNSLKRNNKVQGGQNLGRNYLPSRAVAFPRPLSPDNQVNPDGTRSAKKSSPGNREELPGIRTTTN